MSVENALQQLNIPIKKRLSKNRIMTTCIFPEHKDADPSMVIFLDNGVCHCFGCGKATSVTKLYQNLLGCSYKEAESIIFNDVHIPLNFTATNNFVDNLLVEEDEDIYVQPEYRKSVDTLPLKVESSDYLIKRGFTNSFIDEFNIELCISDKYVDYAYIPVYSDKLGIYTFEARKIYELEYLQKLFKTESTDLKRLKNRFITNKAQYKYTIQYEYLDKPKTFYESGSIVRKLLFNYDSLDFDKNLIICEGIPSIAKLYQYVNKNCTAVFGSNISDEQIKLLKNFKKNLIILSDNDLASYKMIHNLNCYFSNIYVYDCIADDTDIDFVDKIKNCNVVKASNFLVSRGYLT